MDLPTFCMLSSLPCKSGAIGSLDLPKENLVPFPLLYEQRNHLGHWSSRAVV
jgi:hypothetical protein